MIWAGGFPLSGLLLHLLDTGTTTYAALAARYRNEDIQRPRHRSLRTAEPIVVAFVYRRP